MMKQQLIYTIGLPGSGKTTWAKEQQSKNNNILLLNKDDLRKMINPSFNNGVYDPKREKLIRWLHKEILLKMLCFEDRPTVICHDTHVSSFYDDMYDWVADKIFNDTDEVIEVVKEDFFIKTSVAECIRRDALRDCPVGIEPILSMMEYVNSQRGYNLKYDGL